MDRLGPGRTAFRSCNGVRWSSSSELLHSLAPACRRPAPSRCCLSIRAMLTIAAVEWPPPRATGIFDGVLDRCAAAPPTSLLVGEDDSGFLPFGGDECGFAFGRRLGRSALDRGATSAILQ